MSWELQASSFCELWVHFVSLKIVLRVAISFCKLQVHFASCKLVLCTPTHIFLKLWTRNSHINSQLPLELKKQLATLGLACNSQIATHKIPWPSWMHVAWQEWPITHKSCQELHQVQKILHGIFSFTKSWKALQDQQTDTKGLGVIREDKNVSNVATQT